MMRPTNPLITIYTPTYNRAHCIERSIESILRQNYENWKYLIIDDGSTDGTLDVLKKYTRLDHRISFIAHKENQGHLTRALEGERWCHGDLNSRLDSDDYYDDGLFESLVNSYNSYPNIDSFNFVARDERTGRVLYDFDEPIVFGYEDIVNMRLPNIDVAAFMTRDFLEEKISLCVEPFHIITSPLETFHKRKFNEIFIPKKFVTFGWSGDNMTIRQRNKNTLVNNYLCSKYLHENIKTFNKKFNNLLLDSYLIEMNNLNFSQGIRAKALSLKNLKFLLFIKLITPHYIKAQLKKYKGR